MHRHFPLQGDVPLPADELAWLGRVHQSPDDAPGVLPFAVLLLPAGVQASSACPNPPAVGLNVHTDRFHREISRPVLLPNTPT
jgi:hypothetical protein